MPGEFVISPPAHRGGVEPMMTFHRDQQSRAPASEEKGKSKGAEVQPEERRPSLESLDSAAQLKEGAESAASPRRSGMRSAFERAKRKLSLSGKDKGSVLAGSEEEFLRQKQKEAEKERRKAEYERLGLGNKVKFGQGGMQMNM